MKKYIIARNMGPGWLKKPVDGEDYGYTTDLKEAAQFDDEDEACRVAAQTGEGHVIKTNPSVSYVQIAQDILEVAQEHLRTKLTEEQFISMRESLVLGLWGNENRLHEFLFTKEIKTYILHHLAEMGEPTDGAVEEVYLIFLGRYNLRPFTPVWREGELDCYKTDVCWALLSYLDSKK